MLKALIFDVDGTLADTENLHRAAFNAALAEAGLDWHWSVARYTVLLDVAGGKERILHDWRERDPAAAQAPDAGALVECLHALKTRHYTALLAGAAGALRPALLRPGVLRLLRQAHAAALPLAIATTTTPANIAALLQPALGAGWRSLFASVCDGASVARKKPAPDVYLAVLRQLGVAAADCLAFEDSANGLRAATAAGIATVVTPTAFTRDHAFDGALRVLANFDEHTQAGTAADAGQVNLAMLRRWHHDTAPLAT